MDRDVMRVAALRMLMLTAATPAEDSEPTELEAAVGRLLLAGYGERDICAALAIEPPTVHSIVMRLAR